MKREGLLDDATTVYVLEDEGARLRALPPRARVAVVGRQITFDPDILETFDYRGWQAEHYDLLVVCAGIEFADRAIRRPSTWCRRINVRVPVLRPDVWQRDDVAGNLREALRYVTGDEWAFEFNRWHSTPPIGSKQGRLDLGSPKSFAMAYSEGLDSRAVAALSGPGDEALCVRISDTSQQRRPGDTPFAQIPFDVSDHGSQESSFRSRGFQFAAVTAIAAHLSAIARIVVPESGQGALGPVLQPLHGAYRDYRNYPAFFRRMERFIRALLGSSAPYEQPRLWFTKGETLSAFLRLPGRTADHLRDTRSCWQKRRVVNLGGSRRQCGLCAACLLRRMSLHHAGVVEPADAYVVAKLGRGSAREALEAVPEGVDRTNMIDYGTSATRHLQALADMSRAPDTDLRRHAIEIARATTGESEIDTLAKLRRLLDAHAHEWRAFLEAQGQHSFLRRWMEER